MLQQSITGAHWTLSSSASTNFSRIAPAVDCTKPEAGGGGGGGEGRGGGGGKGGGEGKKKGKKRGENGALEQLVKVYEDCSEAADTIQKMRFFSAACQKPGEKPLGALHRSCRYNLHAAYRLACPEQNHHGNCKSSNDHHQVVCWLWQGTKTADATGLCDCDQLTQTNLAHSACDCRAYNIEVTDASACLQLLSHKDLSA